MTPVLSSPHFNDRYRSVDASQKSLTPQRKHRRVLKDGSGMEVWPESVENIFIEGLRKYWESPYATLSQSCDRSRWRNQFLVDYLKSTGVERSKKQVASHIQVLRNLWKGKEEFRLVAREGEPLSELPHINVKQEDQGDPFTCVYDDGDSSSNGTPPYSSLSEVETEFLPPLGSICAFPPDVYNTPYGLTAHCTPHNIYFHSNDHITSNAYPFTYGYDGGDSFSNGTPPYSSPSEVETEFLPPLGSICAFPPDMYNTPYGLTAHCTPHNIYFHSNDHITLNAYKPFACDEAMQSSMASASTILNNNNGCVQAEDQQIKPRFSTYQCFTSCMNASLTFLVTMSIPTFYATLMTKDSVFGIKAAMSTWKELRSINGILLAALVATSFTSSAQVNGAFSFFISSSMIQAAMGMICSTILIIFFSGYRKNYHNSIDATNLQFISWNVWDLFSIPAIWTSWSIITFTVGLIIAVVCSNMVKGGQCLGAMTDGRLMVANVMLSLLIFVATVNFGFFILHLRRVSHAFDQATRICSESA